MKIAIVSVFLFLSLAVVSIVNIYSQSSVPLGYVYLSFGWERRSLAVMSRDDAVAKIREVQARCAYLDNGPWDRSLVCNPTKIELNGLGSDNADWVARQITGVKVGS